MNRRRSRPVAAFLASDDASYITGQTIYPDGGRLVFELHCPGSRKIGRYNSMINDSQNGFEQSVAWLAEDGPMNNDLNADLGDRFGKWSMGGGYHFQTTGSLPTSIVL